MKKTAALFLTFAVLLSLCGAAFAENEIYHSFEISGVGNKLTISKDVYAEENTRYALYAHDGGEINAEGSAYSSNSEGATVIASGEGSVVTVGENVEYNAKRGTAVSAEDGGTVTVRKEIRANGDGSCGISADNGTVTALGNVTARGYESEAIEATNGGTVTVKKEIGSSFRENEIKVIGDRSKGISADKGTVTANGNVTVEGNDSKAIEATNDSTVTVKGDVSSTPSEYYYPLIITCVTTCVDVQSGSTVSVEGNISAEGQRDTYGVKVNAGTATVTGNVEAFIMEETGYFEGAVFAKQGADVTVKGDVSATNCRGVSAVLDSTVTVNGNVSIKSAVGNSQDPIFIPAAEGDTRSNLYITGNVESEGAGYIGVYSSDGKVTVGGNVTAGAGCEAAVNAAFSAEEQAQILDSNVSADKNPENDINPGNATTDKVFLLSVSEAEKYFSSDEDRKCAPTAYAKAQGAWTSDKTASGEATCFWWLRSPGWSQSSAVRVYYDGSVDYYVGHRVDYDSDCVRPALWINLDF